MFESWCEENQTDPLSCGSRQILPFLQEQLDRGKAFSTLRGMVAAIKAARIGESRLSANCSNLVALFLKGARRLRVQVRAPPVPPWDLGMVLEALQRAPFEPIESVNLKWLSLKTAFLLAVTSAKRIGELQALSVHRDLYRFRPDDGGVVLRPNPAFLPKILSETHLNQVIELSPFFDLQSTGVQRQDRSPLCPVRALEAYIRATRAHRVTDQLFVCFKQECLGRPLSKARLSHWITEVIQQAYEQAGVPVPPGVRAHSTRGMAASWALWNGASLSEICTAATWATPLTFTRFYRLNVAASAPFGESVLRATQR